MPIIYAFAIHQKSNKKYDILLFDDAKKLLEEKLIEVNIKFQSPLKNERIFRHFCTHNHYSNVIAHIGYISSDLNKRKKTGVSFDLCYSKRKKFHLKGQYALINE